MATANWYDGLGTLSTEAAGGDFLKTDKLADGKLKTKAMKGQLMNLIAYLGAPKPKKGTPEYHQTHLQEILNGIAFASLLSGNTMHDAALPIDVQTVRNYDLRTKRNHELPKFRIDDTTYLLASFLNIVGQGYERAVP